MLTFLIVYFAMSAVLAVAQVGKPRRPVEPAAAAIAVGINLAIIAALLVWEL